VSLVFRFRSIRYTYDKVVCGREDRISRSPEQSSFFLDLTGYVWLIAPVNLYGRSATRILMGGSHGFPLLPKALKCLVSPIESNRRLSTESKIEIRYTNEVKV
jgi:hypothetical protein